MPTVVVDGVNLFWRDQGTGPPVVFVHGIPTDHRAWEAQIQGLSGQYRTVSYSRRHATPNVRAGDLSDSTIENNAKDLAGLISQLGRSPVHLVGHSYGGFVSAFFATRHPEMVRSLTLVEPAIASLLLRDPKSRGQAFQLLLLHPRVALSASRFLKQSNGPALRAVQRGDLPGAVRFNVDGVEDRTGALDSMPASVQTMMLDNARTVNETDLPYPPMSREDLRGLRAPTLMIHGQTSALWLRAIAEFAGRAIPDCTIVTIPGTGHYPHVQNPIAFNAALHEFLARFPGSN